MSSRLRTLPISSARVADRFWSTWQTQMARVGLPHQWRMLEETGRMENLRRCARGATGGYEGLRFNDSDVYKVLEATAYARALGHDEGLSERTGEAIDIIAAAQGKDGYINSYVTLSCPTMRWKSVNALHEMYCIGHLTEAAVADGGDRLLGVARKAADHVISRFPSDGPPMYPGHQEMELALGRLSVLTGESRYADYARWQLQARGARPSPYEQELADPEVVALSPGVKPLFVKDGVYDGAYAQDDKPLAEQTRAVGHAVRAMYYYSAATDLLWEDGRIASALGAIWNNLTSRQMYVTGGIGSSGRNEGFTDDYDLPNLDAYAETCAGIGLVYWAWRMFCATRDGRYVDVLERVLYNAVLSGVSPSCDRYFYDNPLESDGRHERQPWFVCACCPPNIARLVMSIGQYAVAASDTDVFVALPVGGEYRCPIADVVIESDFPASGDYSVRVANCSGLGHIALRVPEWADSIEVRVNGSTVPGELVGGFVRIGRDWSIGDVVEVSCGMTPKWVQAHPRVLSCAGRAALQRGPLIYCLLGREAGAAAQHFTADIALPVGNEMLVTGHVDSGIGSDLYNFSTESSPIQVDARFVAYHSWADRGPDTMQVWVRRSR